MKEGQQTQALWLMEENQVFFFYELISSFSPDG
jgi:hypothetical protein